MIVGVCGLAGSGKDTVADILVKECGFAKISFADPLKIICQGLFNWDHERLWGPSYKRNEPDPNWDGLTARHALQTLGTEWGRAMHPDLWVRQGIKHAWTRLESGSCRGVVISDLRFLNECKAIKEAGGKCWRVVRPGAGLSGAAGLHASEAQIPTLPVDLEIDNSDTLETLKGKVLMQLVKDALIDSICGTGQMPQGCAEQGWYCTRAKGHEGPCAAILKGKS